MGIFLLGLHLGRPQGLPLVGLLHLAVEACHQLRGGKACPGNGDGLILRISQIQARIPKIGVPEDEDLRFSLLIPKMALVF